MVDSIKITALQDIGANIAYTTLVPVVNMAGTPTTQKANLQNLGNLILNGAGGSYFARAAQANLALSVANAAQPNITSVGTLSSLVVSGNITAANINGGNLIVANFFSGDGGFLTNVAGGGSYSNSNVANYLPTFTGNVGAGNVNVTGTVYTSGISSTGLASLTTLNVSTTANLGAVGNVRITGGTSGQKLTTDGAGNLSWTNDANSSYGNSNVAAYLPTYTGNVGAANINASSNLRVTANTLTWNFTNQGVLQWPGGIGQIDTNNSTFEIHSTNGLQISTNESNSSQSFLFDTAGVFTAPGNVNLLGSRLNVGPTAANVANLLNPTLVIANSGSSYIQAAIINSNANGSSDWSADGAGGSDDAAWTDMGFAGYNFNDANFTITEPGDGYLFVQSYANGLGGNLVLATGDNSNTADIVFATGGFLANAEFARIDHANDVFHLTRANSGIKFDDGSIQTTAYTGGAGAELVNGNNSLVLDGDGNIVLEGTPSGNAINRGLVWDYGANANGVNSTLRQDNGGLILRAWTENGGGANGYSAPVSIITNQDAAAKAWEFDGQGNLTVPTGSINSINDGGELGAYITLTPDLGIAKLAARDAQSSVNYTNTSWSTATYTGTQVDFTNAPDLVAFFNTNQFNVGVNQIFSINGGEPVPFTGYSTGASNAVTVYTSITPEPDPTTVTSIDFLYQLESYVTVDYDGSELNIGATGISIMIDNDQTEGPDITLRSGDDITLQAKDMSLGSEREGGDINLNAGNGADDDGLGNTASTGGDIILDAGQGGDGNSSSGSSGGFTIIRGGAGGAAGVTNAAGTGGYVSIVGGDGGSDGGNTSLGAVGGNVSITAGLSTQEGVNGPNVFIGSGQGGPNALAGSVEISTPASATGPGGTWLFDGNGNLILANGNSVIQSIANSSLDPTLPNVSTMVLTPDPGYSSQALVLDPTAPGHIHLRAFSPSNIDAPAANIFLGGEDTAFEITQGANNQAVIHSGGNTWTFANTGILTLPGEGVIRSLDDTVILQSVDTVSDENVTLRLGTDGAVYFENSTYTNNWLNISTNPAGDANLVSPLGNINIIPAIGVANSAGKNLNLQGGAADQSDFYTGTGGAVNITGGLGSSNDGGGGGPGGNINLTAGVSSDSAGHAGNINITSGSNTWVFDYTGKLTLPGQVITPNKIVIGNTTVTTQGANSIAIGTGAASNAQGQLSVAIGANAGIIQDDGAVAIGANAGSNAQGGTTVAVGYQAGSNTQGTSAVAIGYQAGSNTQGTSAVAIGAGAGITGQGNNSIILNATGANLNQTTANTFTVAPVRNDVANIAQVMFYNTTSKEVTYGNTINVAGNITGSNISATGTLTATGKIGYASGSTVTQITSRGTGVTINAIAGTIITTSVAMVANEIDTFSVINSSVDPNNDIVLAQIVSPNQGTYNCIANPAVIGGFSNGFYINIVNISGFTTADETITVRFMVIKAPNA